MHHTAVNGAKGSELARHRTIDRVAQILELVATTPEGVTLSEIAPVVGAPVSSVHVLLDGLVSAGYVDRVGARYMLGPAPYILTLQARQSPARLVTHGDLERLSTEGEFTVILGVRVGDDIVYIDEAGDDPLLQHIARTHMRRPTLEGVAGLGARRRARGPRSARVPPSPRAPRSGRHLSQRALGASARQESATASPTASRLVADQATTQASSRRQYETTLGGQSRRSPSVGIRTTWRRTSTRWPKCSFVTASSGRLAGALAKGR